MGPVFDLTKISRLRAAQAAVAGGRLLEAKELAEGLLKQNPKDADALVVLAQAALQELRGPDAVKHLERLMKLRPRDPWAYLALGQHYAMHGRFREAVSAFQRLLKQDANNADAISAMARAYEEHGESQKARTAIEPYVRAGTDTSQMAAVYATILIGQKDYQGAVDAALRHVNSPDARPHDVRTLWFSAGLAYERLNRVDDAMDAYRRAHATQPLTFNFDDLADRVQRQMRVFSKEGMVKMARASNRSPLPIFLISRPRSGGTLLERIIGAHPKVHSAGEIIIAVKLAADLSTMIGSLLPYPESVRDMDQHDVDEISKILMPQLRDFNARAARVTNRHLWNWEHLGLMSLVMPGARVIDLRRDAVDNCLACYTLDLGPNHAYNNDLRLLGRVHRLYEQLMDHWHRVLDIPILKVNYEDIVADQEAWSRRIIEFCGLEWSDRCLDFHDAKKLGTSSTSAVTPSFQQVRQPIYKTSVGRAAKFQKHLQPLLEALGEDSREAQAANRS